ncbi:YVTN repeat-like/Quino protein amine dehydrogenase [Cristinia sonorae]|uniref:YVTN repeat-like/Quino protein amine dehydrogenase n=1 Tax=Cristinia sonorae TaxID=1940300 RepID=A0A8K0UNW1_9AGAR|nr:YVTN repeat-like/Quino protein amine dehydrogenase [Cristinia sonorae]
MLAISTASNLVVFDPKKSTTSPAPSASLSSPTAAVWAPDNSVLYVSNSAGIQRFNAQGIFQSTVYESSESVSALVGKDKGRIVVFSTGQQVCVLDTVTGKVAHKFDTHKTFVTSLTLSSDASLLASITLDAVHIHNLSSNTTTALRNLPATSGSVTACAFHPHMRTRLLLGIGNLLSIYETNRPSGPAKVIAMEKENVGRITAITSSPFSKTLIAVGFSGGTVRLVDLEKEKGLLRSVSLNIPLTTLSFSPEGAALYAGTENGKLLILDLRALDKAPKTIIISEEGEPIISVSAQRKLKPGERPTPPPAPKTATQSESAKVRRSASATTSIATDKRATTTRVKVTPAASPRIRTTSASTTPVRLRVTSTTTNTPSPQPPVRIRTISTVANSPTAKPPTGPARPATVVGKVSRTSHGMRRVSGPLSEKVTTPTKSPLNKSFTSQKSDRLDVSVSIDNLLDIPKVGRENRSPQGIRQRTTSSLSGTSSRATRTRTISTTSQMSTSSRAMTGSTLGTSVSGASSISRTTTARPTKTSSTSTKPKSSSNTRKGSKEWAADSMSPIPAVPPLPVAFGEAEPLTAVKCPVPRDRTPSPDLPSTDRVPITPLPPSRAAKGKAPERYLGVLGLGTPEVQRWIQAGDNEKKDGRKVGFAEEDENSQKRGGAHESDDEDDEPQEAKIELTVQVSPRRPTAPSSTNWAPVPSPLRNSLGGLMGEAASVPGPSTNPAQDLLTNLIRDALYDFRRETKAEIVGLHLDLVNMGRGWRKEMKDAMDQWGTELREAREENKRLKEENERLRKRIY